RCPQRRAKAKDLPGPSHSLASSGPGARRAHQQPRSAERALAGGSAQSGLARTQRADHRPSPIHHRPDRPHGGDRSGVGGGERDARGAAAARRLLRAALGSPTAAGASPRGGCAGKRMSDGLPSAKQVVLKLIRALFGLLLLAIGYLGLFTFAALFVRYPVHPSPASPLEQGWQPRGAYHLHSTNSDGRGTPSQIAHAAKQAGLQFIVMTDHNLRTLSAPTYEDGVLVISGVELSTRAGHLVALGTPRGLNKSELDGDPVQRVTDLDGFSFLAHPVQM